eukprot:m.344354 g.344354  ORF g.344354 m.344354 type:complete len:164 (-) comp55789_c0_seq9:56-547(-)
MTDTLRSITPTATVAQTSSSSFKSTSGTCPSLALAPNPLCVNSRSHPSPTSYRSPSRILNMCLYSIHCQSSPHRPPTATMQRQLPLRSPRYSALCHQPLSPLLDCCLLSVCWPHHPKQPTAPSSSERLIGPGTVPPPPLPQEQTAPVLVMDLGFSHLDFELLD